MSNSFSLIIERRISQKSGNPYLCVSADLGYQVKPLCFDSSLIAEIYGVSFQDQALFKSDSNFKSKIIGEVQLV